MPVSVNELKNEIKTMTDINQVFDFLQKNSTALEVLERRANVDIVDYHAQIMQMLEAKQRELQAITRSP